MKGIIKNGLYYILLILLCQSCGSNEEYLYHYDRKMKIGDEEEWTAKDYNDSEWRNYESEVPRGEVFWTRLKVKLPERTEGNKNLGMMIIGDGAYELFYDGVFLGVNGRLKTADAPEIPGLFHKYFRIPDSLQYVGQHRVAIRGIAMHTDSPGAAALFGNYQKLLTAPLHMVKYFFLIVGGFLIAAIYFFFMFYQQQKEYAVLIFGVVCSLIAALILMEYLKYFYDYPYPFQLTRMIIIGYLHMAITILIPLYFMILFSVPKKKIVLGGLVWAIIFIENYYSSSYDWSAWVNDRLMLIATLFIIGYATYMRKKGAAIVVVGVIASGLLPFSNLVYGVPFASPYDISLFIGFVIILLLMLYLLALKRADERLAFEASLVESERLKNELLKKNIKPHFIMNTLTSLIDWVEESPKEGVQFINALAGEFEVLNQIADYKLVPIEQEIKLCKNHLKVMSYRKEINYLWDEENIDLNDTIPPAIIHTAVENGVTHSLPDEKGNIRFKLIYNKTNAGKEYRLQTFAKNRPAAPLEFKKAEGGTGLKYIKSRLQESYGDAWSLTSAAIEGGWETRIVIEG
jgi:sensor histidine kinase YesM